LFNELAPRVHNSLHGSEQVTAYSQFHRHIAVVTGLKLSPMTFDRPWIMVNLIGDQINLIPELMVKGWSVHDYGKVTIKAGRKMGHAIMIIPEDMTIESAINQLKELQLVE